MLLLRVVHGRSHHCGLLVLMDHILIRLMHLLVSIVLLRIVLRVDHAHPRPHLLLCLSLELREELLRLGLI